MARMKAVRGIAFAVLVFSAVLVVMADAPTISYDAQTPDNGTIAVDYINVSVTLGSAGGVAILNWNGANDSSPMTGSGTSFYTNKTGLSNGSTNTFFVYANDSTPDNWSVSNTRTVTVNIPASPPSITSYNPSSTFTSYVGATVEFNITVSQNATINWTIGDVLYPDNTTVATSSSYINSTAGIGTYTVEANASNANGSDVQTWTWTVTNSPGPDPVSGLTVAGRGTTWINWTWTNPSGSFNYTMVKINSSFQTNWTNNYYNYTSFGVGTSNTISLQTVDTSGNINSTVVSNTSSTLNTQGGNNVLVSPVTNLNVTYSQVSGDGNTTANVYSSLQSGWGTPTFAPAGSYYDISLTDATPSGNITVEIDYNSAGIYNESGVRLYHWNSTTSVWDDITTSLDTGNNKVRGNVTSLSPFVPGVPPGPGISSKSPSEASFQTIGSTSQNFTATFNQTVDVSWYINGSLIFSNTSVTSSYYLNSSPATGTWNITVTANNPNGTVSNRWNWTVRSKTYETGNRVWDGSKEMSLTYTWNPMSFYAFYYDLDNNVGSESLKIFLDSTTDRNVKENKLQYSTVPENVSFKYKPWGFYNVTGFMAEKYFAAYTATTHRDITSSPKSTIGSKQLHRILMDDDTRRAVYAGSTLTLSEGYVIKIKDVDITGNKVVLVSLLKDGSEIDLQPVFAGNTYVYSKRVGSVSELPIVVVHIETVFAGREANAAFLKGIFQISEGFTSINTGNRYGVMEITSASDAGITMLNKNSFSLSPGTVNDVMGDIKIIVADNSSVLRFAPMVSRSGTYEVRGTVSQATDTTFDWNPLNFEGFYYDINEDVGSEKLSLTRSGRTVGEKTLVYTTTPQSVSFKEKRFGSYNVIGFMASKYFAGYTAASNVTGGTVYNTIGNKQLHKVLADDDTRRAVYAGSTLTLNEGYVLKMKDVDITGNKLVLVSLLKDGNEIDLQPIFAGSTYTYSKRVGSVSDLPIIAARIETVFAGKEANAAFIKGIFQISESFTSVNQGDDYGIMEVTSVSDAKIEMKNPSSVGLSQASTIDIMGNIKFKVADSGDVRFYPFILVNGSVAAANQLSIDAPSNPMVRDTITITITAGGSPVPGAAVSFDNTEVGMTNSTGKLDYTLTRSGVHNITATKLGYEKATKTIQVAEFVDNRLSIEVPAIIDQGFPVSIKVVANGTAVDGATVTFDNAAIGTTDARGILNYTFTVGGTHNLGASKEKYISVVREINIRMPFSEYKALDLSIMPGVVFTNEEAVIRSNITNAGTKADEKPVELVLNGTVVENRTVALAPGETKEINFTRKEALPGNYTVEILGQKGLLEVGEEPLNLLLIGGIATGFGAIIIYLLTSKSKISLEAVRRLLGKFGKKGVEKVTPPAPPGEGKV